MLDKPQLLIIGNDDEVMDLVFQQLAEALGSCVLEFTSALSIACNSLADTRFDAIVLDPSVANHGTRSAIAVIRSVAPETPLLLLLDRRCLSREIEPRGGELGGSVFKDELKQGLWVEQYIERWVHGKSSSKKRIVHLAAR